jgi:hypothetical protein
MINIITSTVQTTTFTFRYPGGFAKGYPPTLYRVERTPNFQFALLVDQHPMVSLKEVRRGGRVGKGGKRWEGEARERARGRDGLSQY